MVPQILGAVTETSRSIQIPWSDLRDMTMDGGIPLAFRGL